MSIGSGQLTATRQHVADAPSDEDSALCSALCSAHGLRLWRAEDYGWLVRTGPDTTGAVYACIDESGNEFELLELAGGFRWTTHPSLHQALEELLLDAPPSIDGVDGIDRIDRIDGRLEEARQKVDAL
jgi:hypothetical protein